MTGATAYTGRYPIHSHPTCAQWADLALSPRELDALTFIVGYRAEHGFSPTFSEIATALGLKAHKSGPHRLVNALKRKGALRHDRGSQRGIVPVERTVDLSAVSDAAIATEYARRFGAVQTARH
jgi:SOS-response transcriptional repressor LexA